MCNIGWNGFGPEGGAAVGEAMVSNNALLELDVSGNRLTVDTAMKMARMISSNDNIRTLRVIRFVNKFFGDCLVAKTITPKPMKPATKRK